VDVGGGRRYRLVNRSDRSTRQRGDKGFTAKEPTMRNRVRTAAFGVIAAGVILVGVNGQPAASAATTEKEFVRRADAVCAKFGPRFESLPEGVDGAKPVGLGKLMHKLVVALDHVAPPQQLDADWSAMLDLLGRASAKLIEAQRAEASGRASDAEGEALWSLEPRAAKKFDHMVKLMKVEFKFCSFGA
jgi:hypothetical protein